MNTKDISRMDPLRPPEKKQKLDDTIYDVLVLVDPIEVLKVFLPTLHFGCSIVTTGNSQVHKVTAIYRRTPFKAKHPKLEEAKLKTAHKVLDAFIKNFFAKNLTGPSGDLRGKVMVKTGTIPNSYIVGHQKIYSHKKENKERLLYSYFQLDMSSIKINVSKNKRGCMWTGTVTIAGKEYRAEAPKNKNVEEKVVIAVLSSLTPKDMDHLANLRDVKFKEIKPNFQPESSSVEMITLDDDEESVNQVSSTTEINENSVQENKNNNVETVEKESTACNDYDGFGEYVSRLVENKFQKLRDADSSVPDCGVLAGIVMSTGIAINGSKVVSLATGTRSIIGSHLSLEGESVNDCHAEILARRGLVSFLYNQIEKFGTNPEESIFESVGQDGQLLLKVKEDVRFHLYISSTPCGDASLNSLSDAPSSHLRTKIEKSDGTVPIIDAKIQNLNDIILKESRITMSCSDKIARWNVLGLQGSLLSHFLFPIYFHTIVIGDRFHSVNLNRALIDRVSHLKEIPAPFVVAQPILVPGTTSLSITTGGLRFQAMLKYSACWMDGWKNPEVIECTKGKLMDGNSSSLCKRSFLQRFLSVAHKVPEWNKLVESLVKDGKVSYVDLKKASRQFGAAKEKILNASSKEDGFRKWVKKPVEQDTFECSFRKPV